MTKEEAFRLGQIVSEADGGCLYCVQDLVSSLATEWPEFGIVFADGALLDENRYWSRLSLPDGTIVHRPSKEE